LKNYISYEEAIFDSLPMLIREKIEQSDANIHYVQPLEKKETELKTKGLEGENIILKINTAIGSVDGLTLIANKQLQEKINKEKNNLIKERWIKEKEVYFADKTRKQANKYILDIEVTRKSDNIVDTEIVIKFTNFKKGSEEFRIPISFTHPSKIKKIESYFIRLRIAKLLIVLLIITLALFVYLAYSNKKKQIFKCNTLKAMIETRQDLIDNGHFVAALKLADDYLKYFPDDVQILAFRDRILDFTNNDPKKAQKAYVKAQKINLRLQKYGEDIDKLILTEKEKEELLPLLPYSTELKSNFKKLITLEEQQKNRIEYEPRINEIRELADDGNLYKAAIQAKAFMKQYSKNKEIEELYNTIQAEKKKYEEDFKEIEKHFREGEIDLGISLLDELLEYYTDMPEANQLQEKINKNRDYKQVRLKTVDEEEVIDIFLGKQIIIGRSDVNIDPDLKIEDRRISRPHLKLKICGDKLIAEDLKSSAGTFVNAEKIETQKVKDQDIITLSKIYDILVRLYVENNKLKAVKLSDKTGEHIILKEKIELNFQEGDLRISDPGFTLYYSNGLIILAKKENYFILKSGLQVNLDNKTYKVEVIK
jgi:pSer/pThr/pTyr-binding forkhead associated (FHA) protein